MELAPTAESVEKLLNDHALQGWKPILLSRAQVANAPASIMLILEKENIDA